MEQKKLWKTLLVTYMELENTLNQFEKEGYEVFRVENSGDSLFMIIAKLRTVTIPGGKLLMERSPEYGTGMVNTPAPYSGRAMPE